MTVVWDREAEEDLQAIRARANAFSPGAGDRIAERIYRRVGDLERFPELGRVVPEIRIAQIRELLVGDYRVVYRIVPDRIEITTIFHGRQDPLRDFPR